MTGERGLVGREVGHYRILEVLGRGGMGIVYKARDTRLDRTVALKFLPAQSMDDPDSSARFLQEARAASALDHPAICTIHEMGESADGRPFIVMAYVEGESVAEKIARRPLPVAEAVDIASQVALGLARAHERGIVHRDVKPANVMVTPTGQVKILDFGLAKVRDVKLTRTGMTLGTVTCMSPEQVAGEEVDRRTDIWALGVLLYQMITGNPPFRGTRTEAIVAAIMTSDPEPMTSLRTGVPIALDRIVAKALAKDPDDRYQHIDEVPVDLRAIGTATKRPSRGPSGTRRDARVAKSARGRWALVGGVAGLLLSLSAVGLWLAFGPHVDEASPLARFEIPLPAGFALSSMYQPLALSPDGRRTVFSARTDDETRLYLRDLDQLEAVPIDGTDGATDPFFSPDGRWIAFFAGGKLRKVEVDGGVPQTICDAPQVSQGATWGPDGTIVLSLGVTSGLLRVSSSGGALETLTVPDREAGEIGHYWPRFLPNGHDVLFTIWSAEGWRTAVLSAETGRWKVVLDGGAAARYVPTGHLVFAQMSAAMAAPGLLAVPFDLRSGEVLGKPVSVLAKPGMAGPNFAVSSNGTLVYVAGGSVAWAGLERGSLVWRDEQGRVTSALDHPGYYAAPRISPDGTRVAVQDASPEGNVDVWSHELDRGTTTRVTLHGSINDFPIWTPDGKYLAFNSSRVPAGLYRKAADGTGEAEQLVVRRGSPQPPGSWSRDGTAMLYTQFDADGRGDVWVYKVDGGPSPLLRTPASEESPVFSPDGRRLAYVSDVSGRDEVYVRRYPESGGTTLVSTGGGREPMWARNGRALFYRNGDRMMAVDVGEGRELAVGRPRVLFEGRYASGSFGVANYDVTADGRFLLVRPAPASKSTRLAVVLNWLTQLDSLVGRGG